MDKEPVTPKKDRSGFIVWLVVLLLLAVLALVITGVTPWGGD